MLMQLELGMLTQLAIERAERLIQQQQLRTLDQRARQSHPLALAAGELVRLALEIRPHAHDLEDLAHAASDLVLRQSLLLEPEGDVALHASCAETVHTTETSC